MIDLLLLIGLVYLAYKDLGSEAGVIALVVVGILLVGMFISACHDGDKAYNNFVDYWKDGGPKGK